MPKHIPGKGSSCIAYLSSRRNTLYVSRRYRAQVANRLRVEAPGGEQWFLPRRGYTVLVRELARFVGGDVMEDKEGDERIRKGFKCGTNHPAAKKTCTPIDSMTSYDYLGYSECTAGNPSDICYESYVKIGDYHEWDATCSRTWADLPVHPWVCLP